jgi:hypothetical protein
MASEWPASRPYVLISVLLWAFFLFTIAALSWATGAGTVPLPAVWALALVHAASVAGQFALAYRLVARQDEFVRAITAKRVIAAAGVTITIAVFTGVAEQFLGAPRLPMWLVYPLFWGAFGIVTPLIRTSRA